MENTLNRLRIIMRQDKASKAKGSETPSPYPAMAARIADRAGMLADRVVAPDIGEPRGRIRD